MLIRLLHFGATLLLSLALGLYLTPIVRKAALQFGILDKPDGKLKRQDQAVPYLGGIAVYLSFLVALCVVFELDLQLLALLLGSTSVGAFLAFLGHLVHRCLGKNGRGETNRYGGNQNCAQQELFVYSIN